MSNFHFIFACIWYLRDMNILIAVSDKWNEIVVSLSKTAKQRSYFITKKKSDFDKMMAANKLFISTSFYLPPSNLLSPPCSVSLWMGGCVVLPEGEGGYGEIE